MEARWNLRRRHNRLYRLHIFFLTQRQRVHGLIVRISCASSNSSLGRNAARPAATTLNASSATRSVQFAGTERKRPDSSWNQALSSRQFWPRMTRSNSWPNNGWCGCVTRKGRRSTSPCGAVDCSLQRAGRDHQRAVQGRDHSQARALEDARRGRTRHAGVGLVVQPPSLAGTDRLHPASRG